MEPYNPQFTGFFCDAPSLYHNKFLNIACVATQEGAIIAFDQYFLELAIRLKILLSPFQRFFVIKTLFCVFNLMFSFFNRKENLQAREQKWSKALPLSILQLKET